MEQYFSRPGLALDLCDALEGKALVNASAGLFLFAPRRTGKTRFILGDLAPALENRGYLCVYIDLWSNLNQTPDDMLRAALMEKMKPYAGLVAKASKLLGATKIGLPGGTSIEVARSDLSSATSISAAIQSLIDASGKCVVVIVDEAQHALATANASTMLFALKSARDTINSRDDGRKLKLVMTGSSRDKLGYLVLNKQQPFYGAGITEMPHLGKDFAEFFAGIKNEFLGVDEKLTADDVYEAFHLTGYRPEVLEKIIAEVVAYGRGPLLGKYLRDAGSAVRKNILEETRVTLKDLTPVQLAVLSVMAKEGVNFMPFSEPTISHCCAVTGKKITVPGVQKALDSLRKKDVVWKSAYGQYAINDEMVRIAMVEDLALGLSDLENYGHRT